jgi:tRNA U34 5-carboxymethylaminomethyl modifying enzyme MnmG/GidA
MTVESYGPEDYFWYDFKINQIESFELKSGRLLKVDSGNVRVLRAKDNSVYAFVIRTTDSSRRSISATDSVVTKVDTISIKEIKYINVNVEDGNSSAGLAVVITVGFLLAAAVVGLIILANYGPGSFGSH